MTRGKQITAWLIKLLALVPLCIGVGVPVAYEMQGGIVLAWAIPFFASGALMYCVGQSLLSEASREILVRRWTISLTLIGLVGAFYLLAAWLDQRSREPSRLTRSAVVANVGSAEVIDVKLRDFVSPDGIKMQEVLTTWKNTGDTPIRVLDAVITAFNSSDDRLFRREYTIYAASDYESGVAPGNTHQTASGEGFKLIGLTDRATKAEVQITKVSDKSGI